MKHRLAKRLAQATAGLLAPLLAAAGSLAFFSASGAGAAQGSVATIVVPTGVSAQQSGSVSISWTAARLSSGGSVQGYRVSRSDGTAICGSPTLVTGLQCTDGALPPGPTPTRSPRSTTHGRRVPPALRSPSLPHQRSPRRRPIRARTPHPRSPSPAAAPGASYQCAVDSAAFTACSSPQSLKALNANSPLTAGAHTVKVHAVQARSTGPDISYTWSVNTSAPTISSSPPSTSASTSASLAFSHSAYGTFKCQLDGGSYTSCTSPASYIGLASGAHRFQVEAIDSDGVATSAAVYSWTINTSAPTITSEPLNPSLSASASFSFSHSVYASFRCQLDSSGYKACTIAITYTGLSSGWHTFQVKAVDTAGADTAPASYSWFVVAIFPGANTTAQSATGAAEPRLGDIVATHGQRARARGTHSPSCKPPASAQRPVATRPPVHRSPRARSASRARPGHFRSMC